MNEIEALQARVEAIKDKKIIDMNLEELKTFALTLNSKIMLLENNIKILNVKLDEISDNYKGFRSGVAERYLTIDASDNNIQGLLQRITELEKKIKDAEQPLE